MKATERAVEAPQWLTASINIALAAVVLVLGVVTFFATLELALLAGAQVIVSTNDSPVQGSYALGTLRNLWLIGGGAVTMAFVIFTLDYFFKHWRQAGARRIFLRMLAVELAVIGATVVMGLV